MVKQGNLIKMLFQDLRWRTKLKLRLGKKKKKGIIFSFVDFCVCVHVLYKASLRVQSFLMVLSLVVVALLLSNWHFLLAHMCIYTFFLMNFSTHLSLKTLNSSLYGQIKTFSGSCLHKCDQIGKAP